MRVKFLVAVLAFALVVFTDAHAADTPKPPVYPESAYLPLSLEELEALPLAKRIRYLENLKELMLDLEEMVPPPQAKAKTADSSLKDVPEFKEFGFLLEALIEDAYAKTDFFSYYANTVPRQQWVRPSKGKTCDWGFKVVSVNGNQLACVLRGERRTTPCPSGTREVNQHGDGKFACMSDASFRRLSEKNKGDMRAWNKYASANKRFEAANKAYRSKPTKFDNARPKAKLTAAAPKKRVVASEAAQRANKKVGSWFNSDAKTSNAAQSDAEQELDPDSLAVDPTTGDRPNESYSDIKGVDFDKVIAQMKDDVSASDQARENKINLCVGPEREIDKQCPADAIEEGRRALHGTDKAMCIYAGNFSYYKTKTAQPGQCRPVFEFCFGKASCRKADGSKEDGVGRPDAACAAGEVICNPYIFSLQAKTGKPFCVKPDNNATRNCVELTRNQETLRPFVDREWKSALYQHSTQSEDKTTQLQNWFTGFSAFKDKIQEMCFSSENMKKAFCLECNLIKRRLIWMKAELIGGAPDKCDEFKGLASDEAAIQHNRNLKAAPNQGAAGAGQ